jgi:hypothetical protein
LLILSKTFSIIEKFWLVDGQKVGKSERCRQKRRRQRIPHSLPPTLPPMKKATVGEAKQTQFTNLKTIRNFTCFENLFFIIKTF